MQNNSLKKNFDFVNKLDAYPEDLFSDFFKETINVTKTLFKEKVEYTDKSLVKCCVVGNTTTGKSTLINALLKEEILYEGRSKGTLCAAKFQSSSNNEEYFKIYEGYNCLEKNMKIEDIKNINFNNPNYSNFTMNSNNYLDIYLDASKHEILQNFLLVDCPGFDDKNMDAVLNYCKCADIIIFCFKAKSGITDIDINKINEIKSKIGKFHTNFIINCFDELDSIKTREISKILRLHLTGKDAIYFISAREERTGMLNNERHGEFKQFQECLQEQKPLAKVTYHKVYLDLICSIEKWSSDLDFKTIGECRFSDKIFAELQQEIIQLINSNKTKFCKNDTHIALMEYSNQANKAISNFIMKHFIKDHHLNDGIIDDDYFYKQFIVNKDIEKPIFSWYEWGDKNEQMRKSFRDHFIDKSTDIKEKIHLHYKEKIKTLNEELGNYKNELQNITKKINELVMV